MALPGLFIYFSMILWFVVLLTFEVSEVAEVLRCKKSSEDFLFDVRRCGRLIAYEKNLIAAFDLLKKQKYLLDENLFQKDLQLIESKKNLFCFSKSFDLNDFDLVLQFNPERQPINWVYRFKNFSQRRIFCK